MTVGATVQLETVKKTSAALLAVPLAASLLLTACGGDTKPGTSPPTTTSTPSAATSPTTTALKTDPNIPAAARAHTPAGAEAFTQYFFQQVNKAWSTPDPTSLDGLFAPTCTTCVGIRGSAASYQLKGQRYRGHPLTDVSVESLTGAVGANTHVRVTAMQQASAVVDRSDKVVEAVPRTPSTFDMTLTWVRRSWRVSLMQVRK
jgi:hypothetical protein